MKQIRLCLKSWNEVSINSWKYPHGTELVVDKKLLPDPRNGNLTGSE